MIIYEADWVCPATSEPIRDGAIGVAGAMVDAPVIAQARRTVGTAEAARRASGR